MLAIIEEYERRTEANRKVLLGMKLPDDGLTAQAVLNNNHLLVANLKGLFSEEKGEYLPNAIRKNLNGQISRIHQSYAQLEQGPAADHGPRILEQMDGLYAYCLQYGLITFGFPGKEQSQIVQTLRNEVNAIESELDRFSADIREAKDKIDEECSKAS